MRFYWLLNPSGPWRTTNVNLCSKQTFIQLPLGFSCTAVAGGQVWPKDSLSFDLKLGLLQEFLLKLGISLAWLLLSPTSTPAGSTQPCYCKVWKTVMYLVWAPCLQLAVFNWKEYSAANSSFPRTELQLWGVQISSRVLKIPLYRAVFNLCFRWVSLQAWWTLCQATAPQPVLLFLPITALIKLLLLDQQR